MTWNCALERHTGLRMLCDYSPIKLSANTNIPILGTNIEFVLIYGSEAQNISKRICKSLLNDCRRYTCKIWWPSKIKNEELWRGTNQEDITRLVIRRSWLGHQQHRQSSGWTTNLRGRESDATRKQVETFPNYRTFRRWTYRLEGSEIFGPEPWWTSYSSKGAISIFEAIGSLVTPINCHLFDLLLNQRL